MKKIAAFIFTLATVFAFTLGFSNSSASADSLEAVNDVVSAAAEHDYYSSQEYKSEPIETHFPYVNGKEVRCTISQWYIRSVTKCRIHIGESNTSQWGSYSVVHSYGGH